MSTPKFLLIAGLAAGCDKIEEVECSEVDKAFFAAQVEVLRTSDFQSIVRERFAAAGLDSLLSPEDLAYFGLTLRHVYTECRPRRRGYYGD